MSILLLLACKGETLQLSDTQNYSYSGEMDLPVLSTVSGQDVEVCWSELSQDLRCAGLDPVEDIDSLSLLRFPHLDHQELTEGLERDDLTQASLDGVASLETGGESCANLDDLTFFGTPIELDAHYIEGGGSYLLLLSTGNEPGLGSRALAFLEPREDSEIVQVSVDEACGTLDFEAELEQLTPIRPESAGPWTVDWSELSTNGLGQPFEGSRVDRLDLAFYEGADLASLESDFLGLEEAASQSWTVELEPGFSYDLNDLSGFDGLDRSDGVWLLALRCSSCSNPAPLFLGVLEPPS